MSANRRITYLRNRDTDIYGLRYVMALQLKRVVKPVGEPKCLRKPYYFYILNLVVKANIDTYLSDNVLSIIYIFIVLSKYFNTTTTRTHKQRDVESQIKFQNKIITDIKILKIPRVSLKQSYTSTLSQNLFGTDKKLFLHPSTEIFISPDTILQLSTKSYTREICQNCLCRQYLSTLPLFPSLPLFPLRRWRRDSGRFQGSTVARSQTTHTTLPSPPLALARTMYLHQRRTLNFRQGTECQGRH